MKIKSPKKWTHWEDFFKTYTKDTLSAVTLEYPDCNGDMQMVVVRPNQTIVIEPCKTKRPTIDKKMQVVWTGKKFNRKK